MKTSQLWMCVGVLMLFCACDRNNTIVESVAPGPTTCAECHDATNVITGKRTEWAASVHATGTAFEEGTNASCAGCHSGNTFVKRIKAGLNPDKVTEGDTDPTHIDCRACHNIHETYTSKDWALRATKPVALYAIAGATFDGGLGNLCVNCHQPRRNAPVAVNGVIKGITTHWGPHHGPQSSMLLGIGGAGVTGTPSGHYGAVVNSCVQCHMGDGRDHHFTPALATCKKCHPDATNFDIDGVQTEIAALADQLGAALVTLGLLSENSAAGHPTVTEAPEDQGIALWNWLYVHHEDRSLGVHNVDYSRAMLIEGLTRLGLTPAVTTSRQAASSMASR